MFEKTQQKLERRNTYTPTDTSQVCSNCDLSLNRDATAKQSHPADDFPKESSGREETLSVVDLKTFSNNLDVNLHSGKSGRDLRVPVLNMRGEALMPTISRRARILLKQNKAKAVQQTPYTIQLNYPTGETKQSMTLGIDAGYLIIGFSVVTDKRELICRTVELRNDIKRLLEKRRTYRNTRRSRLWHREARFNNRARNDRWLAPSIQHKLDSHMKVVEKLKKILPITEEFDYPMIQKKAKESLKAIAFMNIVKKQLVTILDSDWTYRYITKHDRIKLGLKKSHTNDAFLIAGGSDQIRSGHIHISKQVRRQNCSLYKANFLMGGKLKRNTIKEAKGFRRFDKVSYDGTVGFIFGLRTSGYFDLRTIEENTIKSSVHYKKLNLSEWNYTGGESVNSSMTEVMSIFDTIS